MPTPKSIRWVASCQDARVMGHRPQPGNVFQSEFSQHRPNLKNSTVRPSRMSRPTSLHSLRWQRRRRDHLTRPIQPRHVLQRCLMPTRHVPSLSPTHPNTMSVVCVMCALSHRSGRRRSKTNSTTRPLPTSTRLPFRCTSALYGGLRFPRASSSARGTSRVYHGWAPAAQARRDE